jgi:hypothetical protein
VLWAPVREPSGAGRSMRALASVRSSATVAVGATPTTSKPWKPARRCACLKIAAMRDSSAAGTPAWRMELRLLLLVAREHAAVASAHWCALCAEALSMHPVQALHYCVMSVRAAGWS